jgi:hypothetical protein
MLWVWWGRPFRLPNPEQDIHMPRSSKPAAPISEKRRAANRANAARSTGPRTSEGKARSAQNARKHGFASTSYAVIRLEDAEAVARLRADLVAVYHPVNSQELFALERMALAQLSILRAAQLEASLFTAGMSEVLENETIRLNDELIDGLQIARGQNHGFFLGEGFRRLCAAKGNDPWRTFLRYQAQAERNYRRALEEFERLKALRNELPNEPIVEAQPEETAADSGVENPPFPRPEATDTPLGASSQPEPQRVNGVGSPLQQPPPCS